MEKSLDLFRDWMGEKGYSSKDRFIGTLRSYNSETSTYAKSNFIDAAKLMLIGYLEEYLITIHGIGVGTDSNIYKDLKDGKKYADIRYDQLVKEIETIEGRK